MKDGRIPIRKKTIYASVDIPIYSEIPYPHGKFFTTQSLRNLIVKNALEQLKKMIDCKALFHQITIEDCSIPKLINRKQNEG